MTPVVPNGVKETGVTRAVIVGISDYQNVKITDLQFADRDALAFANYLKVQPEEKWTAHTLLYCSMKRQLQVNLSPLFMG